jgi:hypothetical protein
MHESGTFLAILEEGEKKGHRKVILIVGEERLGPPKESIVTQLDLIEDLRRLERIVRRSAKAVLPQSNLEERADSRHDRVGALTFAT